jgi:hypothetical protein
LVIKSCNLLRVLLNFSDSTIPGPFLIDISSSFLVIRAILSWAVLLLPEPLVDIIVVSYSYS